MSASPQQNHIQTSSSLDEAITFARTYATRAVLLAAIGGVVGIAIALVLPKQWEARSTLQLGQVVNYSLSQTITPIEDPPRAIERLQLPSTAEAVLHTLGLPNDPSESRDTQLILTSLTAKPVRNTNFLELSVRGYTSDDAQRFLTAYQNALIQVHKELWAPSIASFSDEFREVNQSLETAIARKGKIQALADEKIKRGAQGQVVENVVIGELVTAVDSDLRALNAKKHSLQEQLNPQRSYNTRPLGPINISKRPVFPNKILFGIAGAAGGFALALIWALLSDLRLRARSGTEEVAPGTRESQ